MKLNRRSIAALLAMATVALGGSYMGAGLASAAPAQPASAPAAAQKPNLVIFLADDMNQDDVHVYGGDAHTPNFDQMARDGMIFDNGFASSPTCSVSRSSLFTGDYPMHHGGHALQSGIKPGIATMPQILEKQGYEVAIAGKTDIGPRKYFPFEYMPTTVVNPSGKKGLWMELSMPAVDKFLATRDRSKPLALIVADFASHVRWPENHGYDASKLKIPPNMVDTPDLRAVRTMYLTKVTLADTNLGKLRGMLQKYGMTDNTLLFFTADQGAQFPFAKWNLYDAGIKAPFIAVWPGHIKPGSKSSALVSQIDILPTIEQIAGGPALKDVDGLSLMPILDGKAAKIRDVIYAAHSGDYGHGAERNVAPSRTIRTDRYKLIVNFYPNIPFKDAINVNTNFVENKYWLTWQNLAKTDPKAAFLVNRFEHRVPVELYDLQVDPYEVHNLAKDPAQQARVTSMRAQLYQWMKSQGEDPGHVAMPDDAPKGGYPYAQ